VHILQVNLTSGSTWPYYETVKVLSTNLSYCMSNQQHPIHHVLSVEAVKHFHINLYSNMPSHFH